MPDAIQTQVLFAMSWKKKKHHGEFKSEYICWQCNHNFDIYRDLVDHVSKMHQDTQHGGRVALSENNSIQSNNENARESKDKHENMDDQEIIQHPQQQQNAIEDTVQNRTLYPRNGEKYDLLNFFSKL